MEGSRKRTVMCCLVAWRVCEVTATCQASSQAQLHPAAIFTSADDAIDA